MSYNVKFACAAGIAVFSLLGSASLHAQTSPPQVTQQANVQAQSAARQQIELAKATPAQVAAFKANPASLISTNRNGGQSLVGLVQALVLADPDLATIIANIASAVDLSDALASNIGEGLGKAAALFNAAGDTQAAGKVQTAVATASVSKPAIQNGYSSGSNTTTTLSVGAGNVPGAAPAGGGAAAVAGGGVGVTGAGNSASSSGGGNTSSQPSSSSFSNQATTFAGLTNGSAASVSPR